MRPTLQEQLEELVRKHAAGNDGTTGQGKHKVDQHPHTDTRAMTTMDRIAARVAEMVADSPTKP
jgi:hypothetical protein